METVFGTVLWNNILDVFDHIYMMVSTYLPICLKMAFVTIVRSIRTLLIIFLEILSPMCNMNPYKEAPRDLDAIAFDPIEAPSSKRDVEIDKRIRSLFNGNRHEALGNICTYIIKDLCFSSNEICLGDENGTIQGKSFTYNHVDQIQFQFNIPKSGNWDMYINEDYLKDLKKSASHFANLCWKMKVEDKHGRRVEIRASDHRVQMRPSKVDKITMRNIESTLTIHRMQYRVRDRNIRLNKLSSPGSYSDSDSCLWITIDEDDFFIAMAIGRFVTVVIKATYI